MSSPTALCDPTIELHPDDPGPTPPDDEPDADCLCYSPFRCPLHETWL